ncbi:hypothetical protein Rs2_10957 [Raphanus sativus]|nr:hypothetical protein Rs2_10957 [Raphanus sativus]
MAAGNDDETEKQNFLFNTPRKSIAELVDCRQLIMYKRWRGVLLWAQFTLNEKKTIEIRLKFSNIEGFSNVIFQPNDVPETDALKKRIANEEIFSEQLEMTKATLGGIPFFKL